MKKFIKLFFLFIILIPYIIYASSYSLESDNANNYILRSTYVNTYQRYLLDGYKFSNIPFNYENQSDSTFRFGGLLSKKEYDISVRNGKTYLYDGSKYWTLTPDGDDKHYTVTYGGLASKDNGDTAYYSRATEFVKKDTVVKGSGTINDPWTFDPFYNVKFVLEDDTKASFGSEDQNQLVRASCLGPGCEASITINSLNGNIYLSNDCHGTYNNETKKFTVSKVGRDLTCKIKFGVGFFEINAPGATPEKFYVRFKENYYKDRNSNEVLNSMESVPSMACYDFTGYKYKEYDTMLIKANKTLDKYFVDKVTEDTTLVPQYTAHSYNIIYDPVGGSLGTTTSSRKYGEPLYIPTPTKSGYTFKGWSFTGIDSTAKRGDSSTNIASTMTASTPYTNSYYQNLKCGNGTVNATANWDSCLITVTLDKGSGTGGTSTIYEKYGVGWYSNAAGTTATTFVTKPSRSGYIFKGYYTQQNGAGIKVIDEDGNILSNNSILGTGVGSCPGATLYAHYTAGSYTITFYQGNGTSTAGVTQIGTQTCTYGSSCTLKKYADLGASFPYSTVSGCNYTWSFGGWSTTQTGTNVNYTNNQTFTYNTEGDISLYALGTRNLSFAKGKAPISYATTLKQTWNPYSTADTYVTEVTIPEKIDISGWTFVGFKAGSGVANATVTYSASDIGTKKKPGVTTCKVYRSVYKRDNVTLTYNGNGNTGGSTAASKLTQYYNSGIPNNGTNTENKVSVPSFTLATNGFTKTGNSFSKWASISTSGTQYDAGATYTDFVPTVDDTTISQNMYAIWTKNQYTITFDVDGGNAWTTSTCPSANFTFNSSSKTCTKKVTYGGTYGTLPTPIRTDYEFLGWYLDSTKITSSSAFNLTSNKTLKAKWKYNVTPMQSWDRCQQLAYGEYDILTDIRDGNKYKVTKLEDGNCWMTENLRLDFSKLKIDMDDDNTNSYLTHLFNKANKKYAPLNTDWGKVRENVTNELTDNRLYYSTVNMDGTNDKYGVYYDYYIAVGGNQSNYLGAPGSWGQDMLDICPAGWFLPGQEDLINYNNAIGVNNNNGTYPLNKVLNEPASFVYSGYYLDGVAHDRGVVGKYWSSYNANNIHFLLFSITQTKIGIDSDYYHPDKLDYHFGFTVRCMRYGIAGRQYTLSYNSNGGSSNIPRTKTINITRGNHWFNIPEDITPTRTGYDFYAWSTNPNMSPGGLENQYSWPGKQLWFYGDSNEKILYAVWDPHKHYVTYDSNGGYFSFAGSTYTTTKMEATFGEDMPRFFYTPKRDGYTFAGFYYGSTQYYDNSNNSVRQFDVDSDITLKAKWIAN